MQLLFISIWYVIGRDKKKRNLPQKLGSDRSQLQNSTGQSLTLHERWWIRQFVPLEIPAGDPHRHRGLSWRYYDSDTAVAAAPHRSSSRVDQERHQEAVVSRGKDKILHC